MIKWNEQHCGVILASYDETIKYMPDIKTILNTFPENVRDFVFDVKVHMLMPNQYPCIPNWHYDYVPRVDGNQDFDLVNTSYPMYLWLSGKPFTEFKTSNGTKLINAEIWYKFNQLDEHRGTISDDFCWRGFIRATHVNIAPKRAENIKV